jgi:hypothetical protein
MFPARGVLTSFPSPALSSFSDWSREQKIAKANRDEGRDDFRIVPVASEKEIKSGTWCKAFAYDEETRNTVLVSAIHVLASVALWPVVLANRFLSGFDIFLAHWRWWLVWFGTGLFWAFAFECLFVAAGLKRRLEES